MEATFTDAAFTVLLACELSAPLRDALERAVYNPAHHTWRVRVSAAQEQQLVLLLRRGSARQIGREAVSTTPANSSPSDLLPSLPEGGLGRGGGAWVNQLPAPWRYVGVWGGNGWELGSWPYQILVHCDLPLRGGYGLATYVAGETAVEVFASREERDAATDRIAVRWWTDNGNGPEGLTSDTYPVPALYRGPYSRWRAVSSYNSVVGEPCTDHASALLDQARDDEDVSGDAMRWVPDG
ncbi:hypothetical protein [Streptomyces monomycini]|uniref:hypothetical protein n=1 Tax=Streptomyces monomycini TaxID=371720 RepID=UPI001EEBC170|nr:hypothetical protein [Streptomyces monomycini]